MLILDHISNFCCRAELLKMRRRSECASTEKHSLRFTFTVDPANIPTSHLCESVKNGEVAAGVSVVECPKNSPDNSSSSQEFRCVHYSGTLDMSLTLDLGSTSGESNFFAKMSY